MITASLTGLVRIIFWLIVVSSIFRFFIKLTANYAVRRVNEEVKQQQRREGEVHVQHQTNTRKPTSEGEYIDYIEIKD
ncbi:MAG: hypothetical protein ACKO5Y_03205 [Bacteroidota bacterium]